MKKVFLFCIFLIFLMGCGISPDYSKEEIRIFLKGNGYIVIENLEVKTIALFFPGSPYLIKENITTHFNNIIIAKDSSNDRFLLLVYSKKNFPKINEIIKIE